jgi:TatA/E family protein of Tat protein translocase
MVELTVVVIILALVFGAGKLPAMADALGRAVKSLRRKPAAKGETRTASPAEGPKAP